MSTWPREDPSCTTTSKAVIKKVVKTQISSQIKLFRTPDTIFGFYE